MGNWGQRLADRLFPLRAKWRCTVTGRIHDWPDSVEHEPWHMLHLTCTYCGVRFTI